MGALTTNGQRAGVIGKVVMRFSAYPCRQEVADAPTFQRRWLRA
jgi:hypothetical protein